MKTLVLLPLAFIGRLAGALPRDTQDAESQVAGLTTDIQAQAMRQIDERASELRARGEEAKCTKDKLYFRKE